MNSTQPTPGSGNALPSPAPAWRRPARIAVSLLLAWHLFAVLLGPLSVPEAMIPSALEAYVRPYQQAVYINHGYKFFAPDPGPSHLIRYDVELSDGTHRRGEFPDRNEHWPRLLYHRHFMLSEFMGNAPPPPNGDPRLPWDQQPLLPWQREYAQSYAQHLLREHGGRQVRLELVEHGIAAPEQVLAGVRLNDPASYRSRLLGVFEGAQP
ncbi:MAG TPA: hypothetical protein VHY20_02525 [Pirellulales bacterium]|jgi:hypothetical protein|nr:hypothetical protein [Pirellulales bacterium]